MDTRQYKYIQAVAELRNFGLAADQCYITQSTLSTMIGRFEKEIGIKIFDRKTKPVTLTEEGKEVINQIKVINKEISNLTDVIQSLKGEMTGELRVGVIPTIAPYLLPEFLNEFAEKFPNMNFSISEQTTEHIIESLEKRDMDIGIIALPIGNKNLLEIPLYNEPFVIYDCTGDHKEEIDSIDSMDRSKLWLLEEGHCLHSQLSTICEAKSNGNDARVNFDFRAGSIDSLVRFVKINNGKTLLPYLACLDFLPADRRRLTYFKSPVPVRTVGLVVHRHFVKKTLLQALKREIQDKINPLIKPAEKEYVVAPMSYS